MTRKQLMLAGAAGLALLFVTYPAAHAQFTQGPPGNPSGAGIITGGQAPAPTPPHVGSPTPPVMAPGTGPVILRPPSTTPAGNDLITSPGWILSLQGMPALLIRDDTGREALARRLRLSAEQTERLEVIRERLERAARDIRYELLKKRLDMQRLFSDPKTSQEELSARQREFTVLFQRLVNLVSQTALEARAVLTPAQIEKLDMTTGR